jgi:hypothetical protein
MNEQISIREQQSPYTGFLTPFVGEILSMFEQGMSAGKIASALSERVKQATDYYPSYETIYYVLKRYGRVKTKPRVTRPIGRRATQRDATEGRLLIAEMEGTKLKRIIARNPYGPAATDVTADVLALLKDAVLGDLFPRKNRRFTPPADLATLLDKPAGELELSVRSANALENENIIYLGDLVQKTEAEMLRIPNFGRFSLNEVKSALAEMGLRLGMHLTEFVNHRGIQP